jgi:hypothetical protein
MTRCCVLLLFAPLGAYRGSASSPTSVPARLSQTASCSPSPQPLGTLPTQINYSDQTYFFACSREPAAT